MEKHEFPAVVLREIAAWKRDGYELLDAILGIQNGQPAFGGPGLPEDEYYRYNPGIR